MKTSYLIIPLAVIFTLSAAPGTLGDNEIGVCENLESSTTSTVNWTGVAGAILGALPVVGPAFGLLFDVIEKLSDDTNYSEYMADLNECVTAMINEALDGTEYDNCLKRYDYIKTYMEDLLGLFQTLTPENADGTNGLIDQINDKIGQIETKADDQFISFDSANKHEQFTDIVLDSFMAEGVARLAAIIAMKCKGIDQDTILNTVGDSNSGYIQAIENRLADEFSQKSDSIIGRLESSAFHTVWPESMRIESGGANFCQVYPPPEGDGCLNGCCDCREPSNPCHVYDEYRDDLEIEERKNSCDYCNSCATIYDDCTEEAGKNYAEQTYADMKDDVEAAADLEFRLKGYMEEVANNPADGDLCIWFNRGGKA